MAHTLLRVRSDRQKGFNVILSENMNFWAAIGNVGLGILVGLTIGFVTKEARRLALPPATPPEGGVCPVCGTRSLRRCRCGPVQRLITVFTRRWPYGCRRCGWRSTLPAEARKRRVARRMSDPILPSSVIDAERIVAEETANSATKDDVADIKVAVLRHLAALNAGDVAARAKHYLSDSNGFGLDCGPLASGGFNARTAQAALDAGQNHDLRCRDLQVHIHNDAAITTAYLVGTVTTPNGTSKAVTGRGSWVHVREYGTWKIAHTHLSPLDPASSG